MSELVLLIFPALIGRRVRRPAWCRLLRITARSDVFADSPCLPCRDVKFLGSGAEPNAGLRCKVH